MAEHRFLFVRPEDAGSIPAKSRYININGWITFGYEPPKHKSLNRKIDDLYDYLNVDYVESKLAPKAKEEKDK